MMRQRMARLPKPLQMQAGMLAVLAFAVFVWSSLSQQHAAVPNVSLDEARQMMATGATVVDVRGADAFGQRHLPGAVNIPLPRLRVAVPADFALSTAKDRAIVVDGGDDPTLGLEATELLVNAGYTKVVKLSSGVQG